MLNQTPEKIPQLSAREKEILKYAAQDKTVKETSRLMHVSINTIKFHRKNITQKTGMRTAAGMVCYAMLSGSLPFNNDNTAKNYPFG